MAVVRKPQASSPRDLSGAGLSWSLWVLTGSFKKGNERVTSGSDLKRAPCSGSALRRQGRHAAQRSAGREPYLHTSASGRFTRAPPPRPELLLATAASFNSPSSQHTIYKPRALPQTAPHIQTRYPVFTHSRVCFLLKVEQIHLYTHTS